MISHLPISNYQQHMVLAATLLDNTHSHFYYRGKRCGSCHKQREVLVVNEHNGESFKMLMAWINRHRTGTWKFKMWNYFSVSSQYFLKSVTISFLWIKTENLLIMCWGCKTKSKRQKSSLNLHTYSTEHTIFPFFYKNYHLRIQNMESSYPRRKQIKFSR